ncbi:MAG: IclR family transcriptional regulator [Lentisphaeria bacterium]
MGRPASHQGPRRAGAADTAAAGPDTARYHVPNLERALTLLEFLAGEPRGCGVSDLARRLHLPKNSVFRIASTLLAHGYLERGGEAQEFVLGRKLLALGYAAVGETTLAGHALGPMRDLRDRTGETVLLGTLLEAEGVILEQVMSRNPIRFVVEAGHRFPLHTAAPGKALVAFLPEAERTARLARLTFPRFNRRTLTSRAAYERELKNVRRRGYAVDRAEEVEGLHCVAAPVVNHRGYPVAAVWVTAPAYRLPVAAFARLGTLVLDTAKTISAAFGYGVLPAGQTGSRGGAA